MDKPTAQQVKEYADSINFDIDVDDFLNHYDMVGWVYGKNRIPIKSWKACVRTWKKRTQKQQTTQNEPAGEKVKQRAFNPSVFVQCVEGPTTGRYLPIILPESHLKDIPNEQYISAARVMCDQLSLPDGTEWVVREGVTERILILERAAASSKKPIAEPRKKRGPMSINKAVYEQIKQIKKGTFHHPSATDDNGDKEVPFPDDEVPF